MKNYINNFKNCYKNKNVIITGHTGFKGSWLTLWLYMLGANIRGIALDPKSRPSHYDKLNITKNISDLRINILDRKKLENAIINFKPDFVFHLAAQAIVKESYDHPIKTWETNLLGTINVLEVLRKIKHKCTAIIITSDKCYKNKELQRGYKEEDELGGSDPYSASKGAVEIAIQSYINSFFSKKNNVSIAIGRAGNVIGGGDWSKNRILPDCIKSWSRKSKVILRSPNSTRPWQHVLEPVSGYLALGQQLESNFKFHGEAFNFGPKEKMDRTVLDLVKEMAIHWKNVKWEIKPNKNMHEAGLLKLNCKKAKDKLKWFSTLNYNQTIKLTADWYKEYYNNKSDIHNVSISQINYYINMAKNKKLLWTK
tara:strand:- start:1655 stop:2758 length:1104 start_codon:yes stop_codon:yes gene_type:complete